MTLNTDLQQDPELTAATIIHGIVEDLLSRNKFGYSHFPEIVDLAVIHTGLGTLQSRFEFVKQSPSFWDVTYWDAVPRPFLDANALAYASALAAWIRGEQDPDWANGLPATVKRPMRKSLKFLFKTEDSFFHPSTGGSPLLKQSQSQWQEMANAKQVTKQVIAVRHFEIDDQSLAQHELVLLEKLRSSSNAIVAHSISAVTSLKLATEPIAVELRLLAENKDDLIRAKSIIALAKLRLLDDESILLAGKMLDSSVKYVTYAGLFAAESLETVPTPVLRAAERQLLKALQTCNYEFVGLFATAFSHWLDDPESHFERLFENDQPDYLEIALEALASSREQSTSLS